MSELIENKSASKLFEKGFVGQSLSKLIDECDEYELAPLFGTIFREHQPVLEAGCGSGKWCGWFLKEKIKSDGIDWSRSLIEKAQKEMPGSNFFIGDIRKIPKPDAYYGGIISLGAVEHSVEGPLPALNEFARVLRGGGIAIVTVPYGGLLRRTKRSFEKNAAKIKSRFGSNNSGRSRPATLRGAKNNTTKKWSPNFIHKENGWEFFEYEFNKKQMREFILKTDFDIIQEFVAFGNEGILHNFGNISGRWNDNRADVDFTIIGKLLRKIIPVVIMGHMLCYVLKKKTVK
jgi:SAM-dependent methyltransferase